MCRMKQIVTFFLLLAMTAGSCFAIQAEDVQNITAADMQSEQEETPAVRNTSPQIIALTFGQDNEEGCAGLDLYTNFKRSKSTWQNSNEFPMIYRSVNNGKFKKLPEDHNNTSYGWMVWTYPDIRNSDDEETLFVLERSLKNGTFYQYKLKTQVRNKQTQKVSTIATSKVKCIYYLDPMAAAYMRIKNSNKGKTMTISWNKERNPKADGYEVCYWYRRSNVSQDDEINRKFYRKVKGNRTTKLTLKNRTPGKQYTCQIRSYKKYNGKTYYSNWSDWKYRY